MKYAKKSVSFLFLALPGVILALGGVGCTRTDTGSVVGGRGEAAQTEPLPSPDEVRGEAVPEARDTAVVDETYDLDEELLEEDEVEKVTEPVEQLQPEGVDTFVVADIAETSPPEEGYATGYRVQLFATSDLERARELKKIIMAGTGLAVYIEYEGGLYKVRAGDFPGREEAATARNMLVEDYPDCWIVKTTIKKTHQELWNE